MGLAMKQSKVVVLRPRWQRRIASFWQTIIDAIEEKISFRPSRSQDRRSPVGDQVRERLLKTGQLFRTDGVIDELVMGSGYVLRTLNLSNTLTISLVDENGKDLDFDCSDALWPSEEVVKYRFGQGGAFEIGPKLRTLYMPTGEKVLLDQIGILAVLNGDDVEQMRRRAGTYRPDTRNLAKA